MNKDEKYVSGKTFLEEIEKCMILIKQRFGAEKMGDIPNKKVRDWCKFLITEQRNIEIRCKINGYERKDYLANYFRDKTVCLLASLNNL